MRRIDEWTVFSDVARGLAFLALRAAEIYVIVHFAVKYW